MSLKPGLIVMLFHYVSIQNGPCTGTRLGVVAMHQSSIAASLISDSLIGRLVLIPRIKLGPSDSNLAFTLVKPKDTARLS